MIRVPDWAESPVSETQPQHHAQATRNNCKGLVAGGFQRDSKAAGQATALLAGKGSRIRRLAHESTMRPPPNVENMLVK